MHLYFLVRGKRRYVRWLIESLEEVFLPYTAKDPKGNKVEGQVQLVPRPVQLYELVFPEDQKNKVLSVLNDSYKQYSKMHKFKHWIARCLGLKPLSKEERKHLGQFKLSSNIGMHVVGTKKDKFKDGIERL